MQMQKSMSSDSKKRVNIPFSISIYTKDTPIYNCLSAAGLREFLNKQFKTNSHFSTKNIQCIEIKYNVVKNQEMMKFSQSLKSTPLVPDTQFNRIDCNDFMKNIFSYCDTIQHKPMSQQVADSFSKISSIKNDTQDQVCSKLQNVLKLMMTVYNNDSYSQNIKSNQALKQNIQKTKEQIKVVGYFKMFEDDYHQIFEKQKFEYKGTGGSQFNNYSGFYIRTLKNPKISRVGKQISWIDGWKIGFVWQGNFIPYFDIDEISRKTSLINSSIKITSGLMKDSDLKTRKFQVFSTLFQGLYLKFEIRKVHISHIYSKKQNNEEVFYIKMDFPPKFYATVMDEKHDQQIGSNNTWKRIQNFTLLDNDKIKNNELLRLHFFNNVVIRIQTSHAQSKLLLSQIYKQMAPNHSISTFKENQRVLKNVTQHVDYNKFNQKLITIIEQNSSQNDLKWSVQYLILCLLSRGILSAFDIQQLIVFIEQKKNFKTFLYIFDKMCDSQNSRLSGLQYIKDKYEQCSRLSDDLLDTHYQQDFLAVKVWRVQITPSGYLYCNKAPEMKSRMQREYFEQIDHFMRASIVDDDGNEIKNQLYLSKKVFRQMISGFKIVNRKFIPLGWSPSQLRGFSLWYLHQFKNEQKSLTRSQVLNFLGQFQKITPPAKMAARIGQAFSSSWSVNIKNFESTKVQTIEDIIVFNKRLRKQLNFTDGIGKISSDLLQKISLKLKLHNQLGAIQVRYLGAKGVLVLDQQLPKKTIVLRPSMVKYKCKHPNAKKYLDILDWNKYKAGFLNRQIIILLSSRGIPNETFLDLQKDYLKDIESLTYKQCTIFKELVSDQHNQNLFNLQPANKIIFGLIDSGFDLDKEPFFRGVMQILKRNGYEKLKQKSNINVKKSARLIGIIDEYGVLQQNTVYCRVIDPFNPKQAKTVNGNVIVVRNPCLHTADIRKLRAASDEQVIAAFYEKTKQKYSQDNPHPLFKYPNTVIMSQKGDTPITSAISGSDLDGDNFYICWDENLVGIDDEDPYIHIDQQHKKQSKIRNQEENYNEMLNFFCDYMNYDMLGKTANSHLIKADMNTIKKAYDEQCIQLAVAHGYAVDFPKSGYCPPIPPELLMVKAYPDFMEKQDEETYQSQSILGFLYRDVKRKIQAPIVQNISVQSNYMELLDEDLLTSKPLMDFSIKEVKEILQVLYRFAQDIGRIKFLANLDNEFQIYTGNVTAKTKGKPKKNKGFKHGKLMQQIITLKNKYLNEFFSNQIDQIKSYNQCERINLGNIFSSQMKQKASLWYAVSYSQYFKQKLTYSSQQALKTLRSSIVTVKKQSNKSQKQQQSKQNFDQAPQLGLVWFIIPKILMQMKINAVKIRREQPAVSKLIENEQSQIQTTKMTIQTNEINEANQENTQE